MRSETLKLKPYPSGFLGSNEVPQTAPKGLTDTDKALDKATGRSSSNSHSNHTANIEIYTIWNAVVNTPTEASTFDFKERMIKAGLVAFGTKYFSQWLSVQHANPEYTYLHHLFIDQTLKFITNGTRREIPINSWTTLLTANTDEFTTPQYTEFQKEYLNRAILGTTNYSKTITEFLIDWVRQEGGISDMVASLNILFGDR